MSKPSIVLIGAGGHAHACIDVIEQHGQHQIAGLVGMQEEMHIRHLGYAVIATDAELPRLAKDFECALITVVQVHSPDKRVRLYQQAVELGFALPCIVAPTAHVPTHASIGAGTVMMHGAIVNAGARVGMNCIINTIALIERDARVGDTVISLPAPSSMTVCPLAQAASWAAAASFGIESVLARTAW